MEEVNLDFVSNKQEHSKGKLIKYLVIGVIVLIVVIISLFFFLSKNKENSDIPSCEKIEKSSDRDYCYVNLASLKKDIDICDKIENVGIKNYFCYQSVAYAANNPSFCEKIQDSVLGESDSADTCLYNLLLKRGNTETCKKIQDKGMKLICMAIAEKNPALCPDSDDSCHYNVAIHLGDVNDCQNIISRGTKEQCIFYAQHNPDLCSNLDEDQQAKCFMKFAGIMMDSEICKRIKEGNKDAFGSDIRIQCESLTRK